MLLRQPLEVKRALRADVGLACHVRDQSVTEIVFAQGSRHVAFAVRHPGSISRAQLAARIEEYPFRNKDALYASRHGEVTVSMPFRALSTPRRQRMNGSVATCLRRSSEAMIFTVPTMRMRPSLP